MRLCRRGDRSGVLSLRGSAVKKLSGLRSRRARSGELVLLLPRLKKHGLGRDFSGVTEDTAESGEVASESGEDTVSSQSQKGS